MFGRGCSRQWKNGLNQIYRFVKMRDQKDLTTMKKGSTRSKINEKICTNCFKTVKWQILVLKNIMTTLRPIISGIKWDRVKLTFSSEWGSQSDRIGHKIGAKEDMKVQCIEKGVNLMEVPTIFKYGSAPPHQKKYQMSVSSFIFLSNSIFAWNIQSLFVTNFHSNHLHI